MAEGQDNVIITGGSRPPGSGGGAGGCARGGRALIGFVIGDEQGAYAWRPYR